MTEVNKWRWFFLMLSYQICKDILFICAYWNFCLYIFGWIVCIVSVYCLFLIIYELWMFLHLLVCFDIFMNCVYSTNHLFVCKLEIDTKCKWYIDSLKITSVSVLLFILHICWCSWFNSSWQKTFILKVPVLRQNRVSCILVSFGRENL